MARIALSPTQTATTQRNEHTSQDTVLQELVERARGGDDIAFADLYLQYQKPLWNRLAHLVGNDRETVDELCQDTFLKAWQALPGLQPPFNFQGWLYRIAANKAIDFLRKNKKVEFVALAEYEALSESYSPSEILSTVGHEDHVCDMDWLKYQLEQMPGQQRTCLLLQEHWGLSQKEIAVLLHINEKCVSSYISRGHQYLRKAREVSSRNTPMLSIGHKGGRI